MNAILFPGQGSQEVGMSRSLCERSSAARDAFARADAVLGYPLSALCFEGPVGELVRTDRAQPAIYVAGVAAVLAAEETGSLDRSGFEFAAGLSLGEYTACWFAGVFSFEDGLRLVQRRGSAMQSACDAAPSGMLSLLGADREKAEQVCDAVRGADVLVVANLNSPGQVVISGDAKACGRARTAAQAMGVKRAIPLKVAGAFHSPLMQTARHALEQALEETTLSDPQVPVVSNVTAEPEVDAARIRELLSQQVVSPVLWESSMRRLQTAGITSATEAPPGRVLAGLLRKIAPDMTVAALEADVAAEN